MKKFLGMFILLCIAKSYLNIDPSSPLNKEKSLNKKKLSSIPKLQEKSQISQNKIQRIPEVVKMARKNANIKQRRLLNKPTKNIINMIKRNRNLRNNYRKAESSKIPINRKINVLNNLKKLQKRNNYNLKKVLSKRLFRSNLKLKLGKLKFKINKDNSNKHKKSPINNYQNISRNNFRKINRYL